MRNKLFAPLMLALWLSSCSIIHINIEGNDNKIDSVGIDKDTDVAADVSAQAI